MVCGADQAASGAAGRRQFAGSGRHGVFANVAGRAYCAWQALSGGRSAVSWLPVLQLPTDSVLHSKVRSTFGVRGFLRFADQVVTVADAIVEDIRQRITLPASNEVFQPGEAVQFSSGPLKDYQAVFSGYSGEERAIVLISLLGQQNQLLVDLGAVRKL